MKTRTLGTVVLSILMAAATAAEARDYSKSEGLLQYVDPYIGSGGHGHVFVGTSVPYGMIQLGPSNIHKGWDWCSAYHYSDSLLIGFAHTHLSGTGCTDLGDILIMPMNEIRTPRGNQNDFSGMTSAEDMPPHIPMTAKSPARNTIPSWWSGTA